MNKLDEPELMPYQSFPLNGDEYATTEFLKLKQKFGLKNAIETGTCLGYTTAFLGYHFENVRTVEISEQYLNIAKVNRLNNFKNAETFLGSSADLMKTMLNGMSDQTLIFLDAHWGNHCPLKDELSAIAETGIKPVIAIHDFYVPNHPELGYDSIDGQPFTYEWLEPLFEKIYGKSYNFYFNSEAMGAKRGIIYLHPHVS